MIPAAAPLGAFALAALWGGIVVPASTIPVPVDMQTAEPGVWLAEIGAVASTGTSGPAPVMALAPAAAPLAAPDRPASATPPSVPVVRLSDRGWIGEPGDALAPNQPWPARLAEPPALERSLPVYPDAGRRLAVSAGELRLLNGDGALGALAGDWSVAGRRVVLRRGPHRRPLHAPFAAFEQVAQLRAAGAAAGTARLALPLRPAAADLEVPACAIYAGTGGAEGAATLRGQFKPRCYGMRRNLEPVLVDPGPLLFQVHDGPVQQVIAVRDQGVPLTLAGDHPSYAALAAATVASGTYRTCLAAGLLRVGATPSALTADVRGDNDTATGGYGGGAAASIAAKLLVGPGGLSGADNAGFDWPAGECGLWLRGGTVADALDVLAQSVFAWWGNTTTGAFQGGQLLAPEIQPATLAIEPWMMADPPEELGPARVPWWRARIGYQVLGRVQDGADLAGAVTAADRDFWGTAARTAVAADSAISARYPLAEDGPALDSGFELLSDAQALADRILSLFGRPRRAFEVRMRTGAGGYGWHTARLGACVTLRWPGIAALAAARPMLVTGVSSRGDSATLTLWG